MELLVAWVQCRLKSARACRQHRTRSSASHLQPGHTSSCREPWFLQACSQAWPGMELLVAWVQCRLKSARACRQHRTRSSASHLQPGHTSSCREPWFLQACSQAQPQTELLVAWVRWARRSARAFRQHHTRSLALLQHTHCGHICPCTASSLPARCSQLDQTCAAGLLGRHKAQTPLQY